jgi:hypothetical protein
MNLKYVFLKNLFHIVWYFGKVLFENKVLNLRLHIKLMLINTKVYLNQLVNTNPQMKLL